MFTRPAEHAYTTGAILAAEDRLLAAADTADAPAPPIQPAPTAQRLTADQQAAVKGSPPPGGCSTCWSGRAGTGRTSTLGVLRHAWEAAYGRGSVVGLAPSGQRRPGTE